MLRSEVKRSAEIVIAGFHTPLKGVRLLEEVQQRRRLWSQARLLAVDWPETQDMISRVGAYVTGGPLTAAGTPLVIDTLEGALERFERALRRGQVVRLRVFIISWLEALAEALDTVEVVAGDGATWWAGDGVGLTDWMAEHQAGEPEVRAREPGGSQLVFTALVKGTLPQRLAEVIS